MDVSLVPAGWPASSYETAVIAGNRITSSPGVDGSVEQIVNAPSDGRGGWRQHQFRAPGLQGEGDDLLSEAIVSAVKASVLHGVALLP